MFANHLVRTLELECRVFDYDAMEVIRETPVGSCEDLV